MDSCHRRGPWSPYGGLASWEHLPRCGNRWVVFIVVSNSNIIDFVTAKEAAWCADDGL